MTSSLSAEVLPWGKYDPCHRLEHHCADVAACFEALIAEPVLRDRFKKAIGERGLDDVTEARLAVIAFLHDFGKVCTGFQFQVGNRRPETPRRASHLKAFFWACNSPDLVGGLGLNQLSTWGVGLDRLLRAALAHHGRPMTGHELERPRRPDIWLPHDGYDPVAAGRHLLQCARQWFPAAFRPGPQLPTRPALAHLFAGVVAIADQIGSNEELFKREANFDASYMDRARRRATGAVQALGFARAGWASRTTRTDFGALFGDWEPRPLQSGSGPGPARLSATDPRKRDGIGEDRGGNLALREALAGRPGRRVVFRVADPGCGCATPWPCEPRAEPCLPERGPSEHRACGTGGTSAPAMRSVELRGGPSRGRTIRKMKRDWPAGRPRARASSSAQPPQLGQWIRRCCRDSW